MKAYGFKCNKCNHLIANTKDHYLVYGKNADEAMVVLQEAIKEHDIVVHGSDSEWANWTVVIFAPTQSTKTRIAGVSLALPPSY